MTTSVEPAADRPSKRGWLVAGFLCALHTLAILLSAGGWAGLASPWPIPRDDHPFHFHTSVVSGEFLKSSWTTSGYDPSFMGGYILSAITTPSTNPAILFVSAFSFLGSAQAYKLYVVLAASTAAWLMLAVVRIWEGNGRVAAATVLLFLLYLWTDFPIYYVRFGMLGHFLVVPLALLSAGWLAVFLDRGGAGRWLAVSGLFALVLFVHPLGLMIMLPSWLAAIAGRVWFVRRTPERALPIGRIVAVLAWPVVAVLLNGGWIGPAWLLRETGTTSPYAFIHGDKSIVWRLWEIIANEAPIQSILIGGLAGGAVVLARRGVTRLAAFLGFVAAGFIWGYVAAAFPVFAGLQPGRQTSAFYTAAALACGFFWDALACRIGRLGRAMGLALAIALALLGARVFLPSLIQRANELVLGNKTLLDSRPTPQLTWLVDRIHRHAEPGTRILYEEAAQQLPDPFQGDRYGGLLPHLTGVEVIGGPFLLVPMKTNFVQFGDGKLCGVPRWGRDHFAWVAATYRPSMIVCQSPWARAFCRDNADLVTILEDGEHFLIGRIAGGGGSTISGRANVTARSGQLVVEGVEAGVDGRVVLSYHFDPHLRSDPPIPLEPVLQGSDPVPFIGFRPTAGRFSLVLDLSP